MRHLIDLGLKIGFKGSILFRQLGQRLQIARGGFKLLVRLQQRVERFDGLDRFLCILLIVPERRLAHLVGQAVALGNLARNVKESPAAESDGCTGRRYDGGVRGSWYFPPPLAASRSLEL